jgi:hypothetical protein
LGSQTIIFYMWWNESIVGRFFYLRTLISTCTLYTMIALGIQFIVKHFDNDWRTRCM